MLTASYAKDTGTAEVMDDFSLTFTATSDTSATLGAPRQSISGVTTVATPRRQFQISISYKLADGNTERSRWSIDVPAQQ